MAKPRPKQTKVGIESVQRNNTKPILFGVLGVIVVLLIIALIVAATTGKKKDATSDSLVQFQPVTSVGTALPAEYSDQAGTQLNTAAGTVAPELQGKSFDGSTVDIKNDGKAKVVLFIAHWCPHCQREVPLLSPWIKANMAKYPNVEFYAVATATDPSKPNYPPSAWLKTENWPTPIMADDNSFDAANTFGLGAYPYLVALDKDNKVVTRTSGELSLTDFETQIVQAANNGKAATTATTAANGSATVATTTTVAP